MIPTQIALRLVAHRQAALTEHGGLRRSLMRAARDDLAVWAAWLQTHPDALVQVLWQLVSIVAEARIERGLPAAEWPAPAVDPEPDVVLYGGGPDEHEMLDRLGVMLAAFADWRIDVTLHDGSTVTARPARAARRGPDLDEAIA